MALGTDRRRTAEAQGGAQPAGWTPAAQCGVGAGHTRSLDYDIGDAVGQRNAQSPAQGWTIAVEPSTRRS